MVRAGAWVLAYRIERDDSRHYVRLVRDTHGNSGQFMTEKGNVLKTETTQIYIGRTTQNNCFVFFYIDTLIVAKMKCRQNETSNGP